MPSAPIDISLNSPLPGKSMAPAPYLAREECCTLASCPKWERQYDKAGIGVVISGWCEYRAQTGTVMGVPGTIVLGNFGEYFRVRHLESQAVRRLVVWFDRAFLEGVAEAHGLEEPRFGVVSRPPGKSASSMFARMQSLVRGSSDSEDIAYSLAAGAMTIKAERDFSSGISSRDRQRILSAVSYIESAFYEPCSVDELARISGLGRFHFMRLFKAVTGQSANQYVINTRLRAAAGRIAESNTPVSEIALDVGFNDISHFNTCFRASFDCTPRQMRKAG